MFFCSQFSSTNNPKSPYGSLVKCIFLSHNSFNPLHAVRDLSSFLLVLLYKKTFYITCEEDYGRNMKSVIKFLHYSGNGNLGIMLLDNIFFKTLKKSSFSDHGHFVCTHDQLHKHTHGVSKLFFR
jgi:hypothetical protein